MNILLDDAKRLDELPAVSAVNPAARAVNAAFQHTYIPLHRLRLPGTQDPRLLGDLMVYAAGKGHLHTVLFLLDRGVRVDHRVSVLLQADDVPAPLSLLQQQDVYRQEPFVARPSLQAPMPSTALVSAATGGHAAVVKLLLDRGASLTLDKPDRPHTRNLHCAALRAAVLKGHDAVVALLCAAGACVHPGRMAVKYRTGPDPPSVLMEAASRGYVQVVEILLWYAQRQSSSPMTPAQISARLDTAFALAIKAGHANVASLLRRHGARPNAQLLRDMRASFEDVQT